MKAPSCDHTTNGNGRTFVCDLPAGHNGWHQETDQLRDGPQHTNWGDDGLSIYASKDSERKAGRGGA
jgi:hypothetical protein